MLYLHHRERQTKVLGPGTRYAIWVQGCNRHCPGCINPEGQPIDKNGYWIDEQEVLAEIKATDGLRGITISGGEPFLQAEALENLVEDLKGTTNLDVMIYTGYTLSELKKEGGDFARKLINNTDILVDGEYIKEQNNNYIYRGSDNQKIHILTNRYKKFRDYFNNTKNRDVEFVCRDTGELFMIGIPQNNFREKFWHEVINKTK